MTENLYTQYANKYYNPNDDGKKPGDNENWESIQKGFYKIGTSQLETSEGLTLGKGTEDETSVTAAELEQIISGGGTISRIFKSQITGVSFTSGWNVNTLYTQGFYSPERLVRFTPGRNYIVSGIWLAADNQGTQGAIGLIPSLDRTANDNGQIVLPSTITYLGIATGAFTPQGSVEMYLIITERG